MISLLAGKPNAATFPLTSIKLTSRSPTDPSKEIETEINGKALAEGLQYGPTAGLPSLIEWVTGLQEREHGRKKGEGWRVSVGGGSQDVIYKVSLEPRLHPLGLNAHMRMVRLSQRWSIPETASSSRVLLMRGLVYSTLWASHLTLP